MAKVCDQLGRPLATRSNVYDRRKVIGVLGDDLLEVDLKGAILKVSPSVVGIISFGIPPEMTLKTASGLKIRNSSLDCVFMGSGLIVEAESEQGKGGKLRSIVITTSTLLMRSNDIHPTDVKVEVFLADGSSCDAEVLACDFHYNLAVLVIYSSTPLQSVCLQDFDDFVPISPCEVVQRDPDFQLRRHSAKVKVSPGDQVIALVRQPFKDLYFVRGAFSAKYPKLNCKELYSLREKHQSDGGGGPIITCRGDVIGMMMVDEYFMPSNVISRWWNHFKVHKQYCRPWMGLVDFANLHRARMAFLEQLLLKFSSGVQSGGGVIVTEVSKKSAAYRSGLRADDVIVQCDGGLVRSTMELFEKLWVKAGASVDLTLLRLSSGDTVEVTVKIGEARPNNFHSWPIPQWWSMPLPMPMSDSETETGSDSEMEEGG